MRDTPHSGLVGKGIDGKTYKSYRTWAEPQRIEAQGLSTRTVPSSKLSRIQRICVSRYLNLLFSLACRRLLWRASAVTML